MKKKSLLGVWSLLLMSLTPSDSKVEERDQNYSVAGEIFSKVLGEKRKFRISLPKTYYNNYYYPRDYPVIFLLDGEKYFTYVSSLLHQMSIGIRGNYQVPEVILISIENNQSNSDGKRKKLDISKDKSKSRKYQFNPNRLRDMTPTNSLKRINGKDARHYKVSGGGVDFLEFIESELIPYLESNFRASKYRSIIGHSLGGLAVMNALTTKNSTFSSYIMLDPSIWWDDYFIKKKIAQEDSLSGDVYIATAKNEKLTRFKKELIELKDTLTKNNSSALRVAYQSFPNEDHGSLPLSGIYNGLIHCFSGYKLDEPWVKYYSAEEIKIHFIEFSTRHNQQLLPPEEFVNKLGYRAYNWNKTEAVNLFKLNVNNYPLSADAHDSLAEAYKKTKNKSLALEHYKTALHLDKTNIKARNQIRLLSQ